MMMMRRHRLKMKAQIRRLGATSAEETMIVQPMTLSPLRMNRLPGLPMPTKVLAQRRRATSAKNLVRINIMTGLGTDANPLGLRCHTTKKGVEGES